MNEMPSLKKESIESIASVEVLSREAFAHVVYPDGSTVDDQRFSSAARGGAFPYFDPTDLVESPLRKAMYGGESPKFYVLVKEGDVITGIAELEQVAGDKDSFGIKHVSIDPVHQGKGYGRKLLEGIFKFANKEGVALQGSSRSDMGEERLSHIFEALAAETGVEYVSAEDSLRQDPI